MNLDQLPDVALLRVMEFLPFIDQVRVGRVSQRFREFSQIVVSRTKSLNFGDDAIFGRGIEPEQAIALLELCSSNLDTIEFGEGDLASQIFSTGFRLEHCSKLNLTFFRSDLSSDAVSRIISDHLDVLESLCFRVECDGRFNLDDGTIFEKLRHLHLGMNSERIESMIGRCPNLVSFLFYIDHVLDADILDRFLATVPRLQSFEFSWYSDDGPDTRINLGNCANFWLLPLTSLKLVYHESSAFDYMRDGFVRKIVECFPDLEELAFYLEIGAAEALMLRHLVKLRELSANTFDGIDENLHVPIVNTCLESLDIKYHTVSRQALGNMLFECPKLRRVTIRALKDVRKEEDAVKLISYLENLALAAREITIVFGLYNSNDYYRENIKIWKTSSVMRALVEFQERNNFEIRIEDTCSEDIVRFFAAGAEIAQRRALDEDFDYALAFRRMYSIGVDEDEEEIQGRGAEDEAQVDNE